MVFQWKKRTRICSMKLRRANNFVAVYIQENLPYIFHFCIIYGVLHVDRVFKLSVIKTDPSSYEWQKYHVLSHCLLNLSRVRILPLYLSWWTLMCVKLFWYSKVTCGLNFYLMNILMSTISNAVEPILMRGIIHKQACL